MKPVRLLTSLVIPFLAGGFGSLFTIESIPNWYASLNKPFFNPPNSVFGPVWSLLYLLQGIALYLYWNTTTKKDKTRGFFFFGVQIIFNALWSYLFFGLKMPEVAFGEIIMLAVVILLTLLEFRRVNRVASYLLYPYLAWTLFATLLNLSIVLLN